MRCFATKNIFPMFFSKWREFLEENETKVEFSDTIICTLRVSVTNCDYYYPENMWNNLFLSNHINTRIKKMPCSVLYDLHNVDILLKVFISFSF